MHEAPAATLIPIAAGFAKCLCCRNFPSLQVYGRLTVVKRYLAIRRLFAIPVIAALALAPVSRPVMAAAPSDMTSSEMASSEMASSDMASSDKSMQAADAASQMADEMAGDMPCCPSKAPLPADCDKCVFMAACASKCFAGTTAGVVVPPLSASDDILPLRHDRWPDGLRHPPPEHPPRSLV
jgi:hypothetical protein